MRCSQKSLYFKFKKNVHHIFVCCPALALVHAPKAGNPVYNPFGDIRYGVPHQRPFKYYMEALRDWYVLNLFLIIPRIYILKNELLVVISKKIVLREMRIISQGVGGVRVSDFDRNRRDRQVGTWTPG